MKGEKMITSLRLLIFVMALLLAALFIQFITSNKLSKLREVNLLSSNDIVSIKQVEKQLDCLAINIYREAGYEPLEGKVAVAQVTMNRVAHTEFPDDVCGVVYQKNKVMERVVCQFSWYCDSVHRNRPVGKEAYEESMAVAKKVLLEGFRLPSLNHALFYHADYVNPRWRHEKIGKIGQHIFYKLHQKETQNVKYSQAR
jgi:spore germination cell wall hydrolase CwlJ-like protein